MKTERDGARRDGFAIVLRFGSVSGTVLAWITDPFGDRHVANGATPAAALAAAERLIDDIKRRAA